MIAIAFICFAVLILAWMMAPSEKVVAKPKVAPAPIKIGEMGEALA